MIGLKLLVKGNLENNLRYTTPFKNSENPVMTQALIYLSKVKLPRCLRATLHNSRSQVAKAKPIVVA